MEFITRSTSVLVDYILQLQFEENSDLSTNRGLGSQYRLIIFENGNGEIEIDDRTIHFNSTSILCLTENEKITSIDGTNIKTNTLYFQPAVINQNFSMGIINNSEHQFTPTEQADIFCIKSFLEKKQNREIIPLTPNSKIKIEEYLNTIREITKEATDSYWPCLARSYFIELLNYTQRLSLDIEKELFIGEKEINQIISYLNTSYQDKITISDIVRQFCTNRTTISSKFKEVTGYTIIEYLNNIRIEMALLMLRDTTLPINDIMYRVGFNDPAHFIKTFKTNAEMTPSSYRKQFSLFV